MRKKGLIGCLALMLALAAIACSNENADKPGYQKTTLYLDGYNQRLIAWYIIPYTYHYPNVDIKTIQGQSGKKPDILVLTESEFKEKAAKGELASLDEFMLRDSFQMSNLSPAASVAEEILRHHGNGLLYGVAHPVHTEVLYYNIDLFEQYGVPLPTHHMTWPEVLELARRFPTQTDEGEPLYGLDDDSSNRLYGLVNKIAGSKGLSPIDGTTRQVAVNSSEWRGLWEMIMPVMQDGHFPLNQKGNFFEKGQAAMLLGSTDELKTVFLIDSTDLEFNWGVAAHPVDAHRRTGQYDELEWIHAISATSEHKEEAWKYIRYYLERKNRDEKEKWKRGKKVDLEALYSLSPNPGSFQESGIPSTVSSAFRDLVTKEASAVIEGRKTLDEALETLKAEGQQAVDQAYAEWETRK